MAPGQWRPGLPASPSQGDQRGWPAVAAVTRLSRGPPLGFDLTLPIISLPFYIPSCYRYSHS